MPLNNFLAYKAPSLTHFLGTNFYGDDIFQNLLIALWYTLTKSSFLSLISFFLSFLLAFLVSYPSRNLLKKVLFSLCKLLETLPSFLIIFSIYTFIQESLFLLNTLIILSLSTAPFRSFINQLTIIKKSNPCEETYNI